MVPLANPASVLIINSAPRVRQPRRQRQRGVFGPDRLLGLHENVAGIEPGIDAHDGDAGHGLAVRDCPLNRARPRDTWAATKRAG